MVATHQESDYAKCQDTLWKITNEFLSGLRYISLDFGRDQATWNNHLLSVLYDDILEAIFAILGHARDGTSNTSKRELRFLTELGIKLCYVEQHFANKTIPEKIKEAKKLLDSSDIGIKKNVRLHLLPPALHKDFQQELGRLYGSACNWVHLTTDQIEHRISRLARGVTAGKESAPELTTLIAQVERCYAALMVLLLHSVPEWIAGDLLVEQDGRSHKWHFQGSRFISAIDEHHDYKAERSAVLDEVRATRKAAVRF